ncbi:hypothetical protein J5N97_005578 [Dioscorea zingiberensis]|uniref:BHLH domain-containing protein n=1 Tax=Dioscorea zingiberensis TaxID=325984 RepID=A0A9D5DAY2_9LILI|nr:hypothetical protein J5N97_005578 [Dioscorea zingiberensis]
MEGGNGSGCGRKAEKLERKIIEKNRRIHMKNLLFQLSSIIPNTQYHNASGQQGVLLDEATTYIKKLKERVETLELQKKHMSNNMNNGKVTIQVRCLDACMEIVLMSRLMNKSFKLGEVILRILEEEGAEVIHANFSNMEDMKPRHLASSNAKSHHAPPPHEPTPPASFKAPPVPSKLHHAPTLHKPTPPASFHAFKAPPVPHNSTSEASKAPQTSSKPQQKMPTMTEPAKQRNKKPKPNTWKTPTWRTKLEDDGKEHLFISVGLNKGILDGRERMKSFSLITVTERKAGSTTIQDITDVLGCLVDENWSWVVKPLRDGRYIAAFPSSELARKTEKAGRLSVLNFDLSFEPWSPDLWQTGKAEGATCWVIVKNLPMDCWGRDEAACLLKPAGDLVAMDRRSQRYGNDLRLLLRVRWPRKMPASIHCSLGVRQFNYTVELDAGQQPLPWADGLQRPNLATNEDEGTPAETTINTNIEEVAAVTPAEATTTTPTSLPERRLDKGKAPMSEKIAAP